MAFPLVGSPQTASGGVTVERVAARVTKVTGTRAWSLSIATFARTDTGTTFFPAGGAVVPLVAVSTGAATCSMGMSAARPAAMTAQSVAVVTVPVHITRGEVIAVSGLAAASATIKVMRLEVLTASGTATVIAATLSVARPVGITAAGVAMSSIVGHVLSGETFIASSVATASLVGHVLRAEIMTANGLASVTAAARVARPEVAHATGLATCSAIVNIVRRETLTVHGVAVVVDALGVARALTAASMVSQGAADVSMRVMRALVIASHGVATAVATMRLWRFIPNVPNAITLIPDPPNVIALTARSHVLAASPQLIGVSGFTLPRRTSFQTTPSLTIGESNLGAIAMAKGYRVYAVTTSAPARVRLYSSITAQGADVTRSPSIEPGPGTGVVLDAVTPDTNRFALTPQVQGASLDYIPTSNVPMTITATVAGPVTVIVLWVPTE
jgi:hypothetical protein